ncbi:MAG: S8 family serine peptidase [Thermodesulfobacteria bacterium]|nr:S8 family serine peptidase [Thermodesulfobacteriota bacterium]
MKRFFIVTLAFAMLLITEGYLFALGVSLNPNPASVGQRVNIGISASLMAAGTTGPPPVYCEIVVNYGDGTSGKAVCRSETCNVYVSHTYFRAGEYVVHAYVNQSKCNRIAPYPDGQNELLVKCGSLRFSSPSTLPTGEVGKQYYQVLRVVGGQRPIYYSVVSGQLPPGLSLSSQGVISGIPTVEGTYSFIVRATDSCPMGKMHIQKNFEITILGPPQPPQETPPVTTCPELTITTPSALPGAEVQKPYSTRITTSGGQSPVTISLASGQLPPGLVLSSNGLITGTPTTSGLFTFTLVATDSCPYGRQSATRTFSLNVASAPKPRNLSVIVTPNHVTIPRGLPSQMELVYSFSGDHDITTDLTSSGGSFKAAGRDIGSVSKALYAHVVGGRASVREVVMIPVSVLKRAEKLGTTRFFYTRRFSNTQFDLTANVEIIITTEAAAPFSISRLQLYFENNRAEITIGKGQPSPKLFAEIRYTGTGLLKGYWEVDGRPLSTVFRHINYGRSIVLQLPATTPLPTFEPGVHRVRFVILSPKFDFELPQAVYFVRAKSYNVESIRLVRPLNGGSTTLPGLTFQWKPLGGGNLYAYLIEFRESERSKPLYSAYVKTNHYKVPAKIAVRYFSSINKVLWQVKGFSKRGELIGKSPVWTLKLNNKGSYVPNQVIITWMKDAGDSVASALEKRLGIKLLYETELGMLGKVMGVFSTKGQDVEEIIKKAGKIPAVKSAGPNYIFTLLSSSADPLVERQAIYDVLDISTLRRLEKGEKTQVAVIDTGVDVNHPELKGAISLKENFIHGEQFKPEIHGTAVAGIIGAKRNGKGVEGIAQNVAILALRACRQIRPDSPKGQCFTDALADALDYALEHGSKVVNMSFGAYVHDKTLEPLISEGARKGVVFVAPVGNDPEVAELPFPARLKDVIAVGGLSEDGSMYPSRKVCSKADILAPHEKLLTTIPDGHYNFLSGTSMATAVVSGLFALDLGLPPRFEDKPVDLCKWLQQTSRVSVCKVRRPGEGDSIIGVSLNEMAH